MNDADVKARQAKAVRTAIVLAAVALAFFIGSFIFLVD